MVTTRRTYFDGMEEIKTMLLTVQNLLREKIEKKELKKVTEELRQYQDKDVLKKQCKERKGS